MFGRMMNSYYYGKSGKGDFRKEDLPKNRWQLFWEMLRVRLSSLCRLNLMILIAMLPMMIVFMNFVGQNLEALNLITEYQSYATTGTVSDKFPQEAIDVIHAGYNEYIVANPDAAEISVTDYLNIAFWADLQGHLLNALLWLIPCMLITGPVQAGMAYITRNWARDEHAFIWSDFKDAVKENWKYGLGISAITAVMPMIIYTCFTFYGDLTKQSAIYIVPQMITVTLGILWMLATTFMYPIMVSYKVKFKGVLKNSMMLAIARLPHTIAVRLAALIPALLCILIFLLTGFIYSLLALMLYYALFGFAFTRFIAASFTNSIFDKYVNSHIEGAKINQGIASEEDDDDEEEEIPADDAPGADA